MLSKKNIGRVLITSLVLGLVVSANAAAAPVDPQCVTMPAGGVIPGGEVKMLTACSSLCVFGCGFSNDEHNSVECKNRDGGNSGKGFAWTGCPIGSTKTKGSDGVYRCVKAPISCPDVRPPFSITSARVREPMHAERGAREDAALQKQTVPLPKPGTCFSNGSDGHNTVYLRGPGIDLARNPTATNGVRVTTSYTPADSEAQQDSCGPGCRAFDLFVPFDVRATTTVLTVYAPDGRSTQHQFAIVEGTPWAAQACSTAPMRPITGGSCTTGVNCPSTSGGVVYSVPR